MPHSSKCQCNECFGACPDGRCKECFVCEEIADNEEWWQANRMDILGE